MFGTIRKHQTWLWAVIITLTIISFVYFFSPYTKMDRGGSGPVRLGSIGGAAVSEEEFRHARSEIYLRHLFTDGAKDLDDRRLQTEIYQRLFLIHEMKQAGVRVSPEAAARFTRDNLLRQYERNGPIQPAEFVKRELEPRGYHMDDLRRFVEHELGIQEFITSIGLSGKFTSPEEIKAYYIREHEELQTSAVAFNASNYLAGVQAPPDAVALFYSNRLANYRLPERAQIRFVHFNVTNQFKAAEDWWSKTNLNEIVDNNLAQIGTNYALIGKDVTTPDVAKARIREQIIRFRALQESQRLASEFAKPLLSKDSTLQDFEAAAQAANLVVSTCAPFGKEFGPSDLPVDAEFTKAAFARTPAEPLARPVAGRDGFYFLALEKHLPSEIPPLDQVRDKVTADYKHSLALEAARKAGTAFNEALTNGLAQGKTFAEVAAASKLKAMDLSPISISSRALPDSEDEFNLDQLKQVAFTTRIGQSSGFQPTLEGGFVLFVKGKLPLNVARMSADLPTFSQSVRQARMNEAFNEWFRKEADKTMRDTPLFQQQPVTSAPSKPARS